MIRLQRLAQRLHWRVLLVLLLLAMIFVYALLAGDRDSRAPAPAKRKAAAVRVIDSPFARSALRPLSPGDAQAWNKAAPLSDAANPPADMFLLPLTNLTDYQRSIQCMTMAVYYEAGNEPEDGERAVAQVILNRLRHPVYPKTICGVVFEGAQRKTGCQFTFACDGTMARKPNAALWRRAELVATAALAGYVFEPVGMATHYHANYVVPYWAANLNKVATLGAHIFYRWSGRWGLPAAFTGRYAGSEPLPPLPGGAPVLPVTGPAQPTAPVFIGVDDRPVIVTDPGKTPRPSGRTERKAVGMEQRWILPRGEVMDAASGPGEGPARLPVIPQKGPASDGT